MDTTSWIAITLFASDWVVRLILVGVNTPAPHAALQRDQLAALVLFVPILGGLLYALVGTNKLADRRSRLYDRVASEVERRSIDLIPHRTEHDADETGPYEPVTAFATAMGHPPLRGNRLELLAQPEKMLAAISADIRAARHHVHLLTYIWHPSEGTNVVVDALVEAAGRGVECRVLVDAVGSKGFLQHEQSLRLREAGVRVCPALPVSTLRMLFERLDLRNHRKIVVIDGYIGYAGSQNIADSTFRSRKLIRTGPWVDATVRVRGPATQLLALVFLKDWRCDANENLEDLRAYFPNILQETSGADAGATIQVVATGPGVPDDGMRQTLLTAIYAAREELFITTPYFVPDDATRCALEAAARRGVQVILVVPAVSDNRMVVATGRAHYQSLLEAGVQIHHFRGGLLHSKVINVDRKVVLIGSANMDMRSFWLNFEVTLQVIDADFASLTRWMQVGYVERSDPITLEAWNRRPWWKIAGGNLAQVLGPLL